MQKKLSILLTGILLVPFMLRAEWIPLNKQNATPAQPQVILVSDDDNSTVIRVEIPGFELTDFTSEGKLYHKADLLSGSFTANEGFPELPYIARVLAIPDQAGLSVEVLESGGVQTFDNISLQPSRTSWIEGTPETPYIENTKAYQSNDIFPGGITDLDPPAIFRDFRIARVSVYPVRYIAAKKELQVASSITIRINYGPGEVINPKSGSKKPIAPSFGELYQTFIFNYQSVLNKNFNGKEEGHELMLCIMPDEFITSFQIYADWKRRSGIDIHVTKFSDIGANNSNPAIIKNHITDAYHNWEVPPTFVLIIGDNGIFPKYIVNYPDYSFPNEDYFVEIDGNDYFPELMIGRFTNQGDYRMQVMINKFIKYEKTPYIASTDWFKKGTCCSNNAYISQVETKRFAAERMLLDGGFTSVDTMMSDDWCTYDLNDIINAINNGRSYLNYRGEGWYYGWYANCYDFPPSAVTNDVLNGEKFTFVTSIGCGVAMFDAPNGNCFGEEWVEVGSLTSPKGAPAFIGPTSNTHTAYNNQIDKGIYIGMFQEGLETPGQALLRGKLYMYTVFGNEYYVEYHYKIYCVLGDPSIHIWKDVPNMVTASYPASIPIGNSLVEFTVNLTSGGQPVEEALVCVTGESIFATGYTDATGKAYLNIEPDALETLDVTVRGGNVYPFLGTMEVQQPTGACVIEESCSLNDVPGGNGNGIMETSETILASLTIKNVGSQNASNIIVAISTTDEYITITDDYESYGTILAGATAVVSNGFAWTVADDIPDQHDVIFEMLATDGTETWTSYFSVTGHGPLIEFGALLIDDSGGNNNGRMDPGETVDLIIPTYNNGTYQAAAASGSLSCISSYITLNNTTWNFGAIEAGTMEEAVFNVTAAANAPVGTGVNFLYEVTSGGYNVQENIISTIGLIVEDWETGNMSQFNWTTGGSSNWAVTTNNPYEGSYCVKSGAIGGNQSNNLSLQYEVLGPDSISFWYKVSSESGYDYLKFFIDNVEKASWSGEAGWARKAFAVTAGTHIFKWTYSKDGYGVSGSDCGWIDFIIFPASAFEAFFNSNETEICEGESVSFYDQSPAGVISWNWIFEGGTPATSTLQNPVVQYLNAGEFDVSLTVFNGSSSSTLALENYISVSEIPAAAPFPSGPTLVCASAGNTVYSTTGIPGITTYDWVLEPSSAGNVNGTGFIGTVVWQNGFLGNATLKVAGENICGTGAYSTALNITRFLPEVTLEPFNWVCLDWPAFELTGGMPEGGEYSGPGVDNGWFNPAAAGVGTYTITYTYTDPNNCENFATETILVDPCTGFHSNSAVAAIQIFPNPGKGMFTIRTSKDCKLNVTVFNSVEERLWQQSNLTLSQGTDHPLDLTGYPPGIYYIHISDDASLFVSKIIILN